MGTYPSRNINLFQGACKYGPQLDYILLRALEWEPSLRTIIGARK
jgi:hypothetical protein